MTQEPGHIVVICKEAKQVNILELLIFITPLFRYLQHALLLYSKYILERVEHWHVKNAIDVILKWSHNIDLLLEDFAHLEHASCIREFSHEILGDMYNCINANGIEIIFLDKVLNPVEQVLTYVWMLLRQVWQSAQPAVLQLPGVIPVMNVARCMIVFLFIEWNDLGILPVIFALVKFHVAGVIDYDINHH